MRRSHGSRRPCNSSRRSGTGLSAPETLRKQAALSSFAPKRRRFLPFSRSLSPSPAQSCSLRGPLTRGHVPSVNEEEPLPPSQAPRQLKIMPEAQSASMSSLYAYVVAAFKSWLPLSYNL